MPIGDCDGTSNGMPVHILRGVNADVVSFVRTGSMRVLQMFPFIETIQTHAWRPWASLQPRSCPNIATTHRLPLLRTCKSLEQAVVDWMWVSNQSMTDRKL